MNENINLKEILRGCPEGTKLYSTVCGDCTLAGISSEPTNNCPISVIPDDDHGLLFNFRIDGGFTNSECLLFPSKDQRDWSKFKVTVKRFDPKDFKPFDKVLVRDDKTDVWSVEFVNGYRSPTVRSICGDYNMCIPYNEETACLVDSTNDCPEYYKWWESIDEKIESTTRVALYDYYGNKTFVDIPDNVDCITGIVISGDMVMTYPFYKDSSDCRMLDYFDGYFRIEKKDFDKLNNLKGTRLSFQALKLNNE